MGGWRSAVAAAVASAAVGAGIVVAVDGRSTAVIQAQMEEVHAEIYRLQREMGNLTEEFAVAVKADEAETGIPVTKDGRKKLMIKEFAILAGVFGLMVSLWALPRSKICRRCCETRLYVVFPIITVINFVIFAYALRELYLLEFNTIFFHAVKIFDILTEKVEKVLMGFCLLLAAFIAWKFKDRLFEIAGIENPTNVFGEPRDWATCWSMWRFRPIEMFILKVEGLPSAKIAAQNDVFCEVSLGYNVAMRTRVHIGAGECSMFKESVQLNFDPFDTNTRLFITLKNQEVVGSSEIASVQMGAKQVKRFVKQHQEEPSDVNSHRGGTNEMTRDLRTMSANPRWQNDRFTSFDLIPAGSIYLRFAPVHNESEPGQSGNGIINWLCCCCPFMSQTCGGQASENYLDNENYDA